MMEVAPSHRLFAGVNNIALKIIFFAAANNILILFICC